jgi:signal transduction histidine kinase
VLITIEDDGIGFDPTASTRSEDPGLGLIGIRERVSRLNGTLQIESAPGKGTRLIVALPVQVSAVADEPSVIDLSQTVAEPVS